MKKPFLILCVFFVCSCTNDERPSDVFEPEKMTNILMEIHLLEAKVQKLYLKADSARMVYQHYEEMLFEDLGISEEEYNRSLLYYVNNGKELGQVYEQVVDSLKLREITTK